MIVAPGDSLKSMILLYVLGTLAQRGIPALVLDYEWSADRHRERKRRLFGPERLDTLHYRRCRAPLPVELDSIRRYCDAQHIAHIAVDSVGLAADGPLNEDETARRFHQALALLPPALCDAHVPKSAIGADIKTDPHAFGSVYFENLCRMCWAVKKQPRDDENEVSVGLFRTKQNDGERAPAVGWTFTFTPAHITVTRTDLATVAGLADRLPVAQRIAEALKRGPMSYAELATELDAKKDTIIKAATRANGFTKVLSRDGVQRLALVERRPA
jgi:DNA-directed RNA polymerase specialized sigma24 family protein